jgi:phosphoenolpyruvate-protein phosphotransferase
MLPELAGCKTQEEFGMDILRGKGSSGGIAFGSIYYYNRLPAVVEKRPITDVGAEYKRFEHARDTAVKELDVLYASAAENVGVAEAEIFKAHQMMLEDPDYCDSVRDIITGERLSAEYAVQSTAESFANIFRNLDDPLLKERAADIKDISRRVIGLLTGKCESPILERPSIIAADDLSPSDTITINREYILGIITSGGSTNSHTSILSRTMGIPAVVSVEGIDRTADGKEAAVDAEGGIVYLQPDEKTKNELMAKQFMLESRKTLLNDLIGKENVTLGGKRIDIYANIGSDRDLPLVLKNDAGGIGLFRSEFIYLESDGYPSEEKQFEIYRTVLEQMEGRRVVIRTMDIGADKKIDYFELPEEENPALGFRAIRLCLTRPELFRTQLRALHRASVYGRLAVMFPMIISEKEIDEVILIVNEVKSGLAAENIPFSDQIEYGIMIETPAAAVISDLLAKKVDFFSIGTNDLTQYTLAADRQNINIERFVDIHHEAVIRLISSTVKNAHEAGIWCGICGELGADVAMIGKFVEMGVDELSVPPSKVLEVREAVRKLSV